MALIITPEKLKGLEEKYNTVAVLLALDYLIRDLLPSLTLKERLRRFLLVGWFIFIIFKLLFYSILYTLPFCSLKKEVKQ